MRYVFAVFTSRSETLSFASYLKSKGVPCTVVSTPKSVGRACGISVRFAKDYLAYIQSIFPAFYRTFVGFIE